MKDQSGIPEDLRKLYDEAQQGLSEVVRRDGVDESCLPALIERIASQAQQISELQESRENHWREVERLRTENSELRSKIEGSGVAAPAKPHC